MSDQQSANLPLLVSREQAENDLNDVFSFFEWIPGDSESRSEIIVVGNCRFFFVTQPVAHR